jgi:zinc D-Ala-D-Ala carboxypeptidase
MDKISEHITYAEATFSKEALKKGLANIPNSIELATMRLTAEKVFEPVRKYFNKPIAINSFFRSKIVNKKIGGSLTSQHCKGEAIDIDDTLGGVTNKQIFEYIKNNLEFDQLIVEFPIDGKPSWIHVSYNYNKNRGHILISTKRDNKTIYLPYINNEELVY